MRADARASCVAARRRRRWGQEVGGRVRCSIPVKNRRRVLCVFPHYTPSFGTFNHAYRLMKGVRAFMPPQGLLLIAAYMPEGWPVRFIDENIRKATAAEFEWADVILVSGMHVQAPADSRYRRARARGGQSRHAGRPVGVRLARNVPRHRLSPHRRDGRRNRSADRAASTRASRARPRKFASKPRTGFRCRISRSRPTTSSR